MRRRSKIEDMMSSVERRGERLFDSIASLNLVTTVTQWVAGITGEGADLSPQPKRLLSEMLKKARIGLINWGGGRLQCPDAYDVSVSQEAWDGYYGLNTTAICSGLERLLEQEVEERLNCTVGARVTIGVNHGLYPGEFLVNATYQGARGADEAPSGPAAASDAGASGQERRRAGDTGPDGTVYMGRGAARDKAARNDSDTPAQEETPAPKTGAAGECAPTVNLPEAKVSYNGSTYPVRDGFTIGLRRGNGQDQAAIALAPCDDLNYVSKLHGTFAYDAAAGTWSYRQEGRHGSELRRGETRLALSQGQTAELESGDELFMASAELPVIFTVGGRR